jgi:hypothetical protein
MFAPAFQLAFPQHVHELDTRHFHPPLTLRRPG